MSSQASPDGTRTQHVRQPMVIPSLRVGLAVDGSSVHGRGNLANLGALLGLLTPGPYLPGRASGAGRAPLCSGRCEPPHARLRAPLSLPVSCQPSFLLQKLPPVADFLAGNDCPRSQLPTVGGPALGQVCPRGLGPSVTRCLFFSEKGAGGPLCPPGGIRPSTGCDLSKLPLLSGPLFPPL